MPLNKTDGEFIPEFGTDFYVVPVSNYQREPAFHNALDHAKAKFREAGLWGRVRFGPDDVIAQIYPNMKPKPILLFLFCKRVNGEHRYVHYKYEIVTPTHPIGGSA